MNNSVSVLIQCFEKCVGSNVTTIKETEKTLETLSSSPNFLENLVFIIQSDNLDNVVRQVACIYFKNHIRKYWDVTSNSQHFSELSCNFIKSKLIELCVVESVKHEPLKPHLISTLKFIAAVDFPQDWNNLVPDLMKSYVLNETIDMKHRSISFSILHTVLLKYRDMNPTNEVLAELKFDILPFIQVPLLEIFKESVRQLLSNGTTPHNSLTIINEREWFSLLFSSCGIILTLISVELPEFIEDNLSVLIEGFLALLQADLPSLAADKNPDHEETLEELQSDINRILSLFALKYNEEFQPYVHKCVNKILYLLSVPKLQPAFVSINNAAEQLTISSIKFLTAVSRYTWNPSPFVEPNERLAQICEHVIIPFAQLNDTDIEHAQENPGEFIRKSLEGEEEVASCRNSAIELIRGLGVSYEKELLAILSQYITSILASKESAMEYQKEKLVDVVVYLMIGSIVKSEVSSYGVVRVNSSVNVEQFFFNYLANELKGDVNKSVMGRSAVIKFIATFRNQFKKETLFQILPTIIKNLSSTNAIVHTHAAYCAEVILNARELPLSSEEATTMISATKLKFSNKSELKLTLSTVLQIIWKHIYDPGNKITENEYLLRCVYKIFVYLDTEAIDIILPTLESLKMQLEVQGKKIENPVFLHYVFECIAILCKLSAGSTIHSHVEAAVLEMISKIITDQESDLYPYVLQVLGVLVDTVTAASPLYVNLLNNLLAEDQWTASVARVPGIVRVLLAVFRKNYLFGPAVQSSMQMIMQRLEYCLFHKRLIKTGFDFLIQAVHLLPLHFFQPVFHALGVILLKRVQTATNVPIVKQNVSFVLALIECRSPNSVLPQLLTLIQPGLAPDFISNVYLPSLKQLKTSYKKRVAVLATCRLLLTDTCLKSPQLIMKSLEVCAELMGVIVEEKSRNRASLAEPEIPGHHDFLKKQTETTAFEGNFNVLHSAKIIFATQELQEVTSPKFTLDIKECFSNPKLIEKASLAQPLWASITSLLSTITV